MCDFDDLKTCAGCGESKGLFAFGAHKMGRNGKRSKCRECRKIEAAERNAKPEVKARTARVKKAYRATHAEEHAAYNRGWSEANPARTAATSKKWRDANRDHVRAKALKYARDNPARRSANQTKRHADQLLRTPAWSNPRKILGWYMAAGLSGLQVDHVIPLRGKLVSGLHVHNNLQLLTAMANRVKYNNFDVERQC